MRKTTCKQSLCRAREGKSTGDYFGAGVVELSAGGGPLMLLVARLLFPAGFASLVSRGISRFTSSGTAGSESQPKMDPRKPARTNKLTFVNRLLTVINRLPFSVVPKLNAGGVLIPKPRTRAVRNRTGSQKGGVREDKTETGVACIEGGRSIYQKLWMPILGTSSSERSN